MRWFILRRLGWVLLVMLIVTLLAFVIFFVLPPVNPAVSFAGVHPSPSVVAQVRSQLGLNHPIYVQYALFVKHLLLGDKYGWPGLGFSYASRTSVRAELISRAGVTFSVVIGGAVVWLLMGALIGVASALRPRTYIDRVGMVFALFGVSAPVFWLGLILLYVFWQVLHILPGTGYVPLAKDPTAWFTHLILPWFTIAFVYAAFYARMIRGTMMDSLREDYIRTARAKGLRERVVVGKHALKASLTPVASMFGIDVGQLLGGAIIVETVFNLPGLGALIVQAVTSGDLPVVMAITVLGACAVAVMNLIVDIVYAYLDPRVRY